MDGRLSGSFNMISMLGGQIDGSEQGNGEALVMLSDFGKPKRSCLLADYKLIRNSRSDVCLMQTKVAIAVRYDNIDTSFNDIVNKEKFFLQVQIEYLQKRMDYLKLIQNKFSNSCRNKWEILNEIEE